jgi:multidrug efflux pump subunit AcrB
MEKIISYFIKNSLVVNLASFMILIAGLLSVYQLQREIFPNVDFNYVVVTIPYPGTSAEDIEKLITIDAERELREVDGIEELNALSAEGGSILSLKIDPNFKTEQVYQEVKSAMDRLVNLPSEVERPIVKKITNRNRGIMSIALKGMDEYQLRLLSKELQTLFEREILVSKVEIRGYRDEIFYIEADPVLLNKFDVSLTDIVESIRDRQTNVTAGTLTEIKGEKIQESLVRVFHETITVAEIGDIVIRSNDIGKSIKVKDLAQVSRTLKEEKVERRADGKFALYVEVLAKEKSDTITTADKIKDHLEKLATKFEGVNIDYKIFDDTSFYIKRRLGVLRQNGLQGIGLVVLALFLFLNFRVSLITSVGAPFAFLTTFIFMDTLDLTLNMISMFGLILVLGMLVDDSIIVAEQFYQNREKGFAPKDAAKKAALETLAPVTSTILTTMIAFSTLLFIDGIMGKFLWAVPVVVIIALLASWIECFFILPSHLADFGGEFKHENQNSRWYLSLLLFYKKTLKFFLRYSKSVLVLFFLSLVGAIFLRQGMRFELFPSDDATMATINIKGAVGTPLAITNKKLKEIEDTIEELILPEERIGYRTVLGYQTFTGGRSKTGTHYGSVILELTMEHLRKRKTAEIMAQLGEKLKMIMGDFEYNADLVKGGPPSGKPINVELYSDNLPSLRKASDLVKDYLLSNENILSAEIDYEKGKTQYLIKINDAEARRLNISNRQISLELRAAFEGVASSTIKNRGEDVDLWVRLNENSRQDLKTLEQLKIKTSLGQLIPLSKIATIEQDESAYLLRRFNRRQIITISGDVNLKNTTSQEMNKIIKPEIEKILTQFNDVAFELTGENKDTEGTLKSFNKAFVIAAFLIFIILVIQFKSVIQPMIVMSAIPLGLIGVILAFKFFNLSLGFMALMGVLGLVGVVINDSIVMITFINRLVDERGFEISHVIEGATSRLRPVILTTVTTVAGLLPVAHSPDGDPFLKPMAISFAYGLLFSTLLTLIFMPAAYVVYQQMLLFMRRFIKVKQS